MVGPERIMAETAVAEPGSQTQIQGFTGETFSPLDTQGAVAEAERILGEARNQNPPTVGNMTPLGAAEAQIGQPVDITPQGPVPPGGERGRGGDGNGEGLPG